MSDNLTPTGQPSEELRRSLDQLIKGFDRALVTTEELKEALLGMMASIDENAHNRGRAQALREHGIEDES